MRATRSLYRIGRVLFSTRGMQRIRTCVSPVMPGDLLYERAATALPCVRLPAWQRLRIFTRRQQPLLVSELFLEAPFRTCPLSR